MILLGGFDHLILGCIIIIDVFCMLILAIIYFFDTLGMLGDIWIRLLMYIIYYDVWYYVKGVEY